MQSLIVQFELADGQQVDGQAGLVLAVAGPRVPGVGPGAAPAREPLVVERVLGVVGPEGRVDADRPGAASTEADAIRARAAAASARSCWPAACGIGGTTRSEGTKPLGDSGFRRFTRTQSLAGSVDAPTRLEPAGEAADRALAADDRTHSGHRRCDERSCAPSTGRSTGRASSSEDLAPGPRGRHRRTRRAGGRAAGQVGGRPGGPVPGQGRVDPGGEGVARRRPAARTTRPRRRRRPSARSRSRPETAEVRPDDGDLA